MSATTGLRKLFRIKLVTFDVTGTLLKFRKNPVEIYSDIGLAHGVTVDIDNLKKSFKSQWTEMNQIYPNYGNCWKTWWTEFVVKSFRGGGVDSTMPDAKLTSIASDLIAKFSTSECWEVKDGALDVLSVLKQVPNPPKLGVISNFDPRLNRILIETELNSHFNFVLNSHECRVGKPDSKIFEMALAESNGVLASNALHIGDNYKLDYLGATQAGWNAMIVVPPPITDDIPQSVQNAQPPVLFSDLMTLKDYLSSVLS